METTDWEKTTRLREGKRQGGKENGEEKQAHEKDAVNGQHTGVWQADSSAQETCPAPTPSVLFRRISYQPSTVLDGSGQWI